MHSIEIIVISAEVHDTVHHRRFTPNSGLVPVGECPVLDEISYISVVENGLIIFWILSIWFNTHQTSAQLYVRKPFTTIPFVQPVAPLPSDYARPVSGWPWKDDCEPFPQTARVVLRSPAAWHRRARLREPRV